MSNVYQEAVNTVKITDVVSSFKPMTRKNGEIVPGETGSPLQVIKFVSSFELSIEASSVGLPILPGVAYDFYCRVRKDFSTGKWFFKVLHYEQVKDEKGGK